MSATGLQRFVRPAAALPFALSEPKPRGEGCELCSESIGEEHSHVVNIETRRLLCTCRPCYLLFTPEGAGRGNYRAVPDRILTDPTTTIADSRWEELQVPVAMAFFFENSVLGRVVAQYPSPAGATESLLDLAAWESVRAESRLAAALIPDVEALIVRRSREGNEAYLLPIDSCYELVGRLRMHWSGFDGGSEARQDIAEFFAWLQARARPITDEARVSHG